MLLICDKNKRILYFGNIYLGSTVDFAIFKKELMAFNFEKIRLWVDLGFVGIKGVLGEEVDVQIGHKKSKKHPLTDEQKLENCALAKQRIKIENAIGSIKRYYILKHEIRLKKPEKNKNLDLAIEICVGLSNFKLKYAEKNKD
jgi:5-methylcytosine-specific restriction endonuclease McrA